MLLYLSYYLKKTLNIGKKILLVVIVYTAIFGVLLNVITKNRASSSYDPVQKTRQEIYQKIKNPTYQKTKAGKLVISIYRQITCNLMGEACTNNPSDGDKNFPKSTLGQIAALFTFPFTNPPASGIAWIHDSLEKSGFVPKSYAATGIGLAAIKPLSSVWGAFRDISYIVLVLIIVTIGFMIMFRMKINPQTVISLENSLPRIVITLILITFSFAIAGFLIDFMYMTIIILIFIMSRAAGLNVANESAFYINAGPFDTINKLFAGGDIWTYFVTFPNFVISIFGNVLGSLIRIITMPIVGWFIIKPIFWFLGKISPPLDTGVGTDNWQVIEAIIAAPIGLVITIVLALFAGPILLNIVIGLLVALTVIFTGFRIFFIILSTYLKIILLIMFSPLLLLPNAFPGASTFSFGSWFKNLLTELLTFPILVGIILVGTIIIKIPVQNANFFTPPFMFGIDPNVLSFLLGMGLLLMTPDLMKIGKQLITPKPLPLPDVGLGVFFGGAAGGLSTGLGEASKYASFAYYMPGLRPLIKGLTLGMVNFDQHQQTGPAPHPPNCLPNNTFISTIIGLRQIKDLKKDDHIWTLTKWGEKIAVPIIAIVKNIVPSNHIVFHISLSDGRGLYSSGHHPTADGRKIKMLKKGQMYDYAKIVSVRKVKYRKKYVYDILPAGGTGTYWANGILIGSTLFDKDYWKKLRIVKTYHFLAKNYSQLQNFLHV